MTTLKAWLATLAIGLGLLWLFGLTWSESSRAITWLDGGAALLSLACALAIRQHMSRHALRGATLGLSLAVFAICLGSFFGNGALWQTWWNFGLACAYLALSAAAASAHRARQEDLPAREASSQRKAA